MTSPGPITYVERTNYATSILHPFSFGQSRLPSMERENVTNKTRPWFYIYQLHPVSGVLKGRQKSCGFSLGVFSQGTLEVAVFQGGMAKPGPRRSATSLFRVITRGTHCPLLGPSTRNTSFAAAACFKDKDAEMVALAERSDSANEELLLFFFQQDLTTRIQRALNLDRYDVAQELREKLVEVDQEIARQREAKMGSSSSKDDAQDKAITLLRLRNELQKSVEEEDYAGAVGLRDRISKLEAESLAASATALAYQNVQYAFRLGQKVRHTKFGYRGVICGMDPLCCESGTWTMAASVDKLSRGRNQPFYQVLVDMKVEPTLLVTYVAEENLDAPQEPDLDRFDHPYVSFLFYGMDSAGDFIPIKQLREKYDKPRHELPWEEDASDSQNGGGVNT